MSANSIRAFQQANPHRAPTLQTRLREQAKSLRAKAAALLAQANGLDSMADELWSEGHQETP